MGWWKDLSIATRLYSILIVMTVLIATELVTLQFSMGKLSALRAFVGGEGLWSKGQKNAAFSLQRYIVSHDERDYEEALEYLRIPLGDRKARLELQKSTPDLRVVREGFLEGRIHPDDIDAMVDLLRRFYWIKYLDRAIRVWAEADRLLQEFTDDAVRYHADIVAHPEVTLPSYEALARIDTGNRRLTIVEEQFSEVLGEGSRWLEHVVLSLLSLAVVTIESCGLFLTFRTSRQITKGLWELNEACERIGAGNFIKRMEVRSRDEIGELSAAINRMTDMLGASYQDLENRVNERTSELSALASENAELYYHAKAALQAREEFLAIASHELRTPLNALLLQLQYIVQTQKSAAGPKCLPPMEMLEKGLNQVRRLDLLIDELLDLTRISNGKLHLQLKQCDLRPVLFDAVAQFHGGADGSKSPSASKISVQADREVVGRFDPVRVGQVVTNLVSNAVKYGGGNPIELSLEQTDERVILTIRDEGQGIPEDKLEHIFHRFERVADHTAVSGLGLGLYITSEIVKAHGGTIAVDSKVGGGSRFTVDIPMNSTS